MRPRWEWRIFEVAPASFIDRILLPTVHDTARTSDEIYLISDASPNNVKVRSATLDVKVLERTTHDGLELWRPTFKHAFPIPASDLVPVWKAWNLAGPVTAPVAYTLDAFLSDVVAANSALHAIRVTKTRTRFDLLGCSAERASLTIDGTPWETVAVEHEDPERVARAVATLGANPPRALSYPALLKRIAGAMKQSTRSGERL